MLHWVRITLTCHISRFLVITPDCRYGFLMFKLGESLCLLIDIPFSIRLFWWVSVELQPVMPMIILFVRRLSSLMDILSQVKYHWMVSVIKWNEFMACSALLLTLLPWITLFIMLEASSWCIPIHSYIRFLSS
jgi:hypothetical protein